jgi:predicted RNase H-like HicB family nuclease
MAGSRIGGIVVSTNRKYLVIVEQAENNYAAYSPDLPGCVATGPTREETLHSMRSAIQMHLAGMREDGEPIPEPRTKADYISVPA